MNKTIASIDGKMKLINGHAYLCNKLRPHEFGYKGFSEMAKGVPSNCILYMTKGKQKQGIYILMKCF